MTGMSVLRKAMCKIGRYSGEWSLPGSRCEIVRICDSCGKLEEETHHASSPHMSTMPQDRTDHLHKALTGGDVEVRPTHSTRLIESDARSVGREQRLPRRP